MIRWISYAYGEQFQTWPFLGKKNGVPDKVVKHFWLESYVVSLSSVGALLDKGAALDD